MFAYIIGKLASKTTQNAVIDVNGVGYFLEISCNTACKINVGDSVKLFTELCINDQEMRLFGFFSQEEKAMFLRLTSISGIGPKSAVTILSGAELARLAVAIIEGDAKFISKIKGVGKKTAERIILELKEKLAAEHCPSDSDNFAASVGLTDAGLNRDTKDAIDALRTLGLTQAEAVKAVKAAQPNSKTIEELISNALKQLN
jgi:Holliday junction DNA helicase RuvA